mgnify:CR=1 FL=1
MSEFRRLFTSEAVSIGHPDHVCDMISDSILDACLREDKYSRVACETMVKGDFVILAGEITTKANINVEEIAKKVIKNIGYTYTPRVLNLLQKQSQDIALGTNDDVGGAGDQGIMFGFANSETPQYMPLAITMAHELVKLATDLRKSGKFLWAGPDMKSQVTLDYTQKQVKVDTILMSIQHDANYDEDKFKKYIVEHIMKVVASKYKLNEDFNILINPTGRFVIGGPEGDAGLTGRKIIVDTYGGYAPHGGGAFSGKDPTKVDRSAAYMARYLSKNIVASKIASECLIQLSYAIGVAQPISISVNCKGTNKVDEEKIIKAIYENFDLSPKGIIEKLNLRTPVYSNSCNGGHFGREYLDEKKLVECCWEKLDSVNIFKKLV